MYVVLSGDAGPRGADVWGQHSEHFVQLFGWFENPRGNVFLAMEYVPYGDLAGYIKWTPGARRESREVTKQLLAGLSVLHSCHICHRDLKPLVGMLQLRAVFQTWCLQLSRVECPSRITRPDQGQARGLRQLQVHRRNRPAHAHRHRTLHGSGAARIAPGALPPGQRLHKCRGHVGTGFIVHELLTGRTPFLETPVEMMSSGYPTVATAEWPIDMRLLLQFCDGDINLPLEPLQAIEAPPNVLLFLYRLVVPDPRNRATAAQALLHPWITGQPHVPSHESSPHMDHVQMVHGGSSLSLHDRALAQRVHSPPYIPLGQPSWVRGVPAGSVAGLPPGGQLATASREGSVRGQPSTYVAVSPTTADIDRMIASHPPFPYVESPFGIPPPPEITARAGDGETESGSRPPRLSRPFFSEMGDTTRVDMNQMTGRNPDWMIRQFFTEADWDKLG